MTAQGLTSGCSRIHADTPLISEGRGLPWYRCSDQTCPLLTQGGGSRRRVRYQNLHQVVWLPGSAGCCWVLQVHSRMCSARTTVTPTRARQLHDTGRDVSKGYGYFGERLLCAAALRSLGHTRPIPRKTPRSRNSARPLQLAVVYIVLRAVAANRVISGCHTWPGRAEGTGVTSSFKLNSSHLLEVVYNVAEQQPRQSIIERTHHHLIATAAIGAQQHHLPLWNLQRVTCCLQG
jgi:hypothetical protein